MSCNNNLLNDNSEFECQMCGKCCSKHWIVKLSSNRELNLFNENDIVFGNYIYTDTCKYFINNICTIHENKPFKCKEYFCEGKSI